MPEESTSRELFPLSIVILTKRIISKTVWKAASGQKTFLSWTPEAVIGRSRLRDPSGLM